MKKVISMNHSSSTSKWKPQRWVRFDLMLMMKDIYIVINSNLSPLTKFTSSRSTEFKENGTSPMEHLSNDHLEHHNQHENSHNLCIEIGHPVLSLQEINGKSQNGTIRISQWRERHCRTNTSIRRNKSNRAGVLRVTVRDPSMKIKHLKSFVSSPEFTRSTSSTRIG